jgi:hypothetical protein
MCMSVSCGAAIRHLCVCSAAAMHRCTTDVERREPLRSTRTKRPHACKLCNNYRHSVLATQSVLLVLKGLAVSSAAKHDCEDHIE